MVATRNQMLALVGKPAIWNEERAARYYRHSPPIDGPDAAVVPIEEILTDFEKSQDNPSQIFVAHRCVEEHQCVSAVDVTVEFDDNGGSMVEYSGDLELTFTDSSSVQGSFQARVRALLMLCA